MFFIPKSDSQNDDFGSQKLKIDKKKFIDFDGIQIKPESCNYPILESKNKTITQFKFPVNLTYNFEYKKKMSCEFDF